MPSAITITILYEDDLGDEGLRAAADVVAGNELLFEGVIGTSGRPATQEETARIVSFLDGNEGCSVWTEPNPGVVGSFGSAEEMNAAADALGPDRVQTFGEGDRVSLHRNHFTAHPEV